MKWENQIIKVKCEKCNNEYEIRNELHAQRKRNKRPNYCQSCMKLYKDNNNRNHKNSEEYKKKASEKTKKQWENMSSEEYEKRSKAAKDQFDNMTASEKSQRIQQMIEGYQKYWENLSDEERAGISNKISERQKEAWKNLSDDEKGRRLDILNKGFRAYFDNLSEDELMDLSKRGQDQWHDMTDDKKNNHAIVRRKIWDSLTDEEKINRLKGLRDWYNNLSEDDKLKRRLYLSMSSKKYWDNISIEKRNDISRKAAAGRQKHLESLNMGPNKNEIMLIEYLSLNKIKYQWQYMTMNEDIHEIYPSHPIKGLSKVSIIKMWDFIIRIKDKGILVDIDGKYHNLDIEFKRDGINQKEYTEFLDSRRVYFTNDMDAYVILCYDDELKDDTPVKNIITEKIYSFKEFMNELKWEMLSDKDKRKLLKEWLTK